jgi:hypothetical protein
MKGDSPKKKLGYKISVEKLILSEPNKHPNMVINNKRIRSRHAHLYSLLSSNTDGHQHQQRQYLNLGISSFKQHISLIFYKPKYKLF